MTVRVVIPLERPEPARPCGCFTCVDDPAKGFANPALSRFIVCAECGCKRCPHATDHRLACTGSNLPGQPGSRYV